MAPPLRTAQGGGELKLPPGFRFHPTDTELLEQYLIKKVRCCPLPASVIPEIELSKFDPWELPGNGCGSSSSNGLGKQWYFFNFREAKYRSGGRSNRATASGYWKATGKDRQVLATRANQVIGMKKVLVFYRGKPPHGSRTDWVMHEYRVHAPVAAPQDACAIGFAANCQMQDEWVLCRIFQKKRSSKDGEAEMEEDETTQARHHHHIRFIDFLRQGSSSSAPEHSCVTDISEDISNDEVVSSS